MRKKSALIALVIIALGLVGTSLSTLYRQNEHIIIDSTGRYRQGTYKVSYGFPLGWHGYSQMLAAGPPSFSPIPKIYWYSLESLLLDATFWFAISFSVCIAAMKSVNILHETIPSKISGTLQKFFSQGLSQEKKKGACGMSTC